MSEDVERKDSNAINVETKKRRNRFLDMLKSRDIDEAIKQATPVKKHDEADEKARQEAIEVRKDAALVKLYNIWLNEQERETVDADTQMPWEDAPTECVNALLKEAVEIIRREENPDGDDPQREKLYAEREKLERERLGHEQSLKKGNLRSQAVLSGANADIKSKMTPEEIEYDDMLKDLLAHAEKVSDNKPNNDNEKKAQSDKAVASMVNEKFVEKERQAINEINEKLKKTEDKIEDIENRPPEGIGARVFVWISDDHMEAWGAVIPPLHGGEEIENKAVISAIAGARLSFGVIRESMTKIADPDEVLRPFCLAKGRPVINGCDGKIEDLVLQKHNDPEVDINGEYVGRIDFKELNLVTNVKANQELCKIIPPTSHSNGKTVLGEELPAKVGYTVNIPVGINTVVNDNGTAVIAKISGQVMMKNGRYCVDNLLVIAGDVDLSTGNLSANGSILVTGNVSDGFLVEAKGDVTIRGNVSGASIVAGGSVVIVMGMNAGNRGSIKAGRDVRCRYLENGIVKAGGDVYLESCVNSNIYSDHNVYVTSGRGTIIGGTVIAMEGITAIYAGNKINRSTFVAIGTTPQFEESIYKLNDEVKTLNEKCKKDEIVISKLKNMELPPDKAASYDKVVSNYRMNKLKIQRIESNISDMIEYEGKLKTRRIRFGTIYPNVTVSIDGVSRLISAEWTRCQFRRKEDEVELMSDSGRMYGK